MIIQVAEVLAGVRGIPVDAIIAASFRNTCSLFFPDDIPLS